jgi:hypothetical protein
MRPAMSIGKVLALSAALVAGLAVAASIWLNPPSENRARAMDSQRLWQLSRIESAISNHYRLHQKLPANLGELTADKSDLAHGNLRDPGTGQMFEYEAVSERGYRLCAVFERGVDNEPRLYVRRHKAGRDCFEQKVEAPGL